MTTGAFAAWYTPAEAGRPWAWRGRAVSTLFARGMVSCAGAPIAKTVHELTTEGKPLQIGFCATTAAAAPMDLADEDARHRVLTDGPVGGWHTVPGSHTQLFDESIRFNVDGTGKWHSRSVLQVGSSQRFLWRVAGYGVIECQPVYDTPEVDDAGEPEIADWFRLTIVIEPCTTDTGARWVLRERDVDGFWDLCAPVVPDDEK